MKECLITDAVHSSDYIDMKCYEVMEGKGAVAKMPIVLLLWSLIGVHLPCGTSLSVSCHVPTNFAYFPEDG